MDFFRRALNPWAQEILLGVSWDLLWAAIVVGAVFVVAHAVFSAVKGVKEEAPTQAEFARAAGVPDRVVRHTLASRVSHWILAASVLTLLVTAFVPILGLKFPWVTIHWIAGLVLAAYTVYHTIHATTKRSLRSMWLGPQDVREGMQDFKHFLGKAPAGPKPGKWGIENKGFHHITAVAGLLVVFTGLLMMLRVDTILSEPNQYMFSDSAWGVIFVLHGLAAVTFVTTTIMHIYFALRPEKLYITASMLKGTITREKFVAHHDPERWQVAARPAPAAAGASRAASIKPE